jgi:hypothetical protein
MRSKNEFVRTKMLKGFSAILAAAACAGVIVGFVPEPDPAAAAAATRSTPRNEQGNAAVNGAPIVVTTFACTQTWPYYEQSCLRDGRQIGGGAPTARVIPSGYQVKAPAARAIPNSHQVKAPVSKIARLAGGSR